MSGATMVPEEKMATEQQSVSERQQQLSAEATRGEANVNRSVLDIIASARRTREVRRFQTGSIGAWSMSLMSAALLWACFTPVNASPLAWVALVPLLLLVRIEQRVRWMYTAVYGGSLLGQLATLQWMRLSRSRAGRSIVGSCRSPWRGRSSGRGSSSCVLI